MRKFKKKAAALAVAGTLALGLGLTGCGDTTASSSTAGCAFIVGNGTGDNDANIHKVVLPGGNLDYDSGREIVRHLPCNSRNYVISPTSGDKRGTELFEVFTANGTRVKVQLIALWTLNQNEDVLRATHDFGQKYRDFFSSNSIGGNGDNNATEGWNSMLGENFWEALNDVAAKALRQTGDDVWRLDDPALKESASEAMSVAFADAIRVYTGLKQDLFCGSGNSEWNPNKTKFTCTNVRIILKRVEPANEELKNLAETEANRKKKIDEENKNLEARTKLAQDKYGDLWQEALFCEDHKGAFCTVGGNAVNVQLPAPAP